MTINELITSLSGAGHGQTYSYGGGVSGYNAENINTADPATQDRLNKLMAITYAGAPVGDPRRAFITDYGASQMEYRPRPGRMANAAVPYSPEPIDQVPAYNQQAALYNQQKELERRSATSSPTFPAVRNEAGLSAMTPEEKIAFLANAKQGLLKSPLSIAARDQVLARQGQDGGSYLKLVQSMGEGDLTKAQEAAKYFNDMHLKGGIELRPLMEGENKGTNYPHILSEVDETDPLTGHTRKVKQWVPMPAGQLTEMQTAAHRGLLNDNLIPPNISSKTSPSPNPIGPVYAGRDRRMPTTNPTIPGSNIADDILAKIVALNKENSNVLADYGDTFKSIGSNVARNFLPVTAAPTYINKLLSLISGNSEPVLPEIPEYLRQVPNYQF